MQARLIAAAALFAAFASPAAAQARDGGIWRAPGAVQGQTTPQEGRTDALLELGGVEGDSGAAPAAEQGVQSNSQGTTALLVPAVQQVRGSRLHEGESTADGPQMDGVVVLNRADGQQDALTDGLLIMRSQEEASAAPNDPEMPICAHCGADVAQTSAPAAQESQQQPPRRAHRSFSLSIGGLTVGSGGVSVAAGDVAGDGRGDARSARRDGQVRTGGRR